MASTQKKTEQQVRLSTDSRTPDNDTHTTLESSQPSSSYLETLPSQNNSETTREIAKEKLDETEFSPEKPPVGEGTSRESHKPVHRSPTSLSGKLKILPNKPKDDLTIQIEKIMEEGLKDAYKELTPVQQQEFKIKGEETANSIRQLLLKTKVKVKKIFRLLMEWLSLLPGVSRFFLQQEAKIKADKILHLKHHQQQHKHD